MSSPVQTPAGPLVPDPTCQGCVLQGPGRGFMRPTGQPHSGLVLIGEALGADEALAGEPFVGNAGHLLNKMLRRMKLRRDHVRINNIVWCQPPQNDLGPYDAALAHCLPHLLKDVRALQATFPRKSMHPAVVREDQEGKLEYPPVSWAPDQPVLVAMGNVAFKALTGWSGIAQFRGYVFWSDVAQAWVVPTYHPAYLLRGNTNQTLWFKWDLEKALKLTRLPHFKHVDYMPLIDPAADAVQDYVGRYYQALKADPNLALSVDIENPNNVMSRIGFAFGPTGHETLTLSWSSHYMPAIRQLLATSGRTLGWNLTHDEDNLRAEGVPVNGRLEDTMDAWHILHSDLDKSLGEVATQYLPWVRPWKHRMKEAFEYYNAMDSLSLWIIDQGVSADLKAAGLWQVWQDHIQLRTVTRKMSARGMLVDVNRQQDLSTSLGMDLSSIEQAMQPLVPDQLKGLDPKNGYVKDPADTEGLVQQTFLVDTKVCSMCGEVKPSKAHFVQKKGTKNRPAPVNPCATSMAVLQKDRPTLRWVRRLPFTPSTQQLQAYAKHHGHKVYTSWSTGNITMNEEAIGKLVVKYPQDPLYPLILKHRDLQKTKSTYVDIKLGPDRRVHTTLTNKPSTLRYASEEPNMQNWPPFARQLCIAPPGQVLWKRDYSAIEAVLVGYDALSARYTRMAKLGIHDFVNAFVLRERLKLTTETPSLSWSDADLKALFKDQKARFKPQREMCKRIVHLSNYLGTADRIYMMNRTTFPSRQAAYDLQSFYFELFPEIPKWHRRVCEQVQQTGYITNAWGYRHYYFSPFTFEPTPDGTFERQWGEDAKRLVAFGPQSNAAGIIKRAMLLCDADPMVSETLLLTIHDELLGACAVADYEAVQLRAQQLMEAPLPVFPLDPSWNMGSHLSIGTEGSCGYRWSEMTHVDPAAALLEAL